MFAAGHETTASVLSFMIYEIGSNSTVYEKYLDFNSFLIMYLFNETKNALFLIKGLIKKLNKSLD